MSPCDSAMEKQVACAAAINSSGLVRPSARSVRAVQLTGIGGAAPLASATVPEPSISVPCQTVLAVLFIVCPPPLCAGPIVPLQAMAAAALATTSAIVGCR